MRRRFSLFYLLLLGFLVITILKSWQLWPKHEIVMSLAATGYFVAMIGWLITNRQNPLLIRSSLFRQYAWLGSSLLGIWATFFLFSLSYDFLALLLSLMGSTVRANGIAVGHGLLSPPRWILLFSVGTSLLGLVSTLRGPRVKQVIVRMAGLSPELENISIVQISDLHIGPTVQKKYVEKMVNRINQLGADIIVITGDIADGLPENLQDALEPLRELQAKLGRYYVLGNHEFYWGGKGWTNALAGLGYQVLTNDCIIVRVQGKEIAVAGIPDPVGAMIEKTPIDFLKIGKLAQGADLRIVLSHQPSQWESAREYGFQLMLSGHTHGGQFFPFNLLMPLAHKYYRGLHRIGKIILYVNPGTGYWGPPNRFGVPAEITYLQLAKT